METGKGSRVPIMKMGEITESKKLLFLNILIPSLLKSNNTLVKETKPMVNSDSGESHSEPRGVLIPHGLGHPALDDLDEISEYK